MPFGGIEAAYPRVTQVLPKVYPRVTQAQRCCLDLGRVWVRYSNSMGGVGEKEPLVYGAIKLTFYAFVIRG